MSKHTPGPWTLTEMDQGRIIHGANDHLIETIYPQNVNTPANARLIAAAPDMLEALQEVSTAHNNTTYAGDHPIWNALEKADRAISKATNEE